MKVEIRDITKEEAVPYGDNADIVANAQKSGADSTPAATSCGNFATNRSLVG